MATLNQKQMQKLLLKLSPQQIQMIKLLELPTLQLEQRIKQEIEENPVLEDEIITKESEEKQEEKKDINVEEYIKEEESTPSYKLSTNNFSKDNSGYVAPISYGKSLYEYLEEQLSFKQLSEKEKIIGKYIIDSIDEDGYLRRDLSSIVDDIAFSFGVEITEDEIEKLLSEIQEFEPRGIGARNLQECLLIQLRSRTRQNNGTRLAIKILTKYFDEFSKKHYQKLMQRLSIDEDSFREAIEEILKLHPKPGNLYNDSGSDQSPNITPDFMIESTDSGLSVCLNSPNIPDVKISPKYVRLIEEISAKGKQQSETDKETISFVKQKIDSARWFIAAIKQRQNTLINTMRAIVEYQKDFFIDGDEARLRPMILKDIADITNLDVSTISRVVNSKYVQTRFGIFPLKYFFSEAMLTDSGEEVSSYEIKKILTESIEAEDKRKPYTDEVLMNMLNEKGYQIARRTVAKYREMLGIPVARLRKEI